MYQPRRLPLVLAALLLYAASAGSSPERLKEQRSLSNPRFRQTYQALNKDAAREENTLSRPFLRHHSDSPDAYGYIFRDSEEPDGPQYTWEDISTTGEQLEGLADDALSDNLPLPWSFPFYGAEYSSVRICSNGFLTFSAGSATYNNTPLPDPGGPNNLLAFFWDDLNPAAGGAVYYGVSGDAWICQFQAIPEYGGAGTITAQVALYPDGSAQLRYQSLDNGLDVDGESIGTESLDGSAGLGISYNADPAAYPYNGLCISIALIERDAQVTGQVRDADTGLPIADAEVSFSSLTAITDTLGFYELPALWSGEHPVTVLASFHRFVDTLLTVNPGTNNFDFLLTPSDYPAGLVGHWSFDDPQDLLHGEPGNDLELVGTHTPVAGPDSLNGAVEIGVGSFYRCYHDIPANGGSGAQWVNDFTIVMDIRIPVLGSWYALYQTNYSNTNDADAFVDPSGHVGINDTGWSAYALLPGEWYRLAISANLGSHYDYYLDGQLLLHGGEQVFEGRFSLYPADDQNQVLFFADDNGEDNPLQVADLLLFDRDLTAGELADLGGYGHQFEPPAEPVMEPYLQTPTPTSIYVCWSTTGPTESRVEYGLTPSLGNTASGEYLAFDSQTIWHWTQLTNLTPDTDYYYCCYSQEQASDTLVFHTQIPDDDDLSPVRFAIYGDTRTDYSRHRQVVDSLKATLERRFGPDYHRTVRMIWDVGDIVTSGGVLSQYVTEYFHPVAPLSGSIPFQVSIGNHEGEAQYYYDYMKYEDVAGPEGERYYHVRSGPVLFVALNSNTQGDTQLDWLESTLSTAQEDPEIQWIFVFTHHPGHSEIWPDGNTAWIQDQVIPLLQQYSKVELLSYGHSHDYERGATSTGNLRLMLSGGGGAALDRWGMYGNQQDYPELEISLDHYCYTVVDVDCAAQRYTAHTYSLGHTDLPRANVVVDSFSRDRRLPPPELPGALAPTDETPLPLHLTASEFAGSSEFMSSRFQVTTVPGDYSAPLLDTLRDYRNLYGDTGAPDYEPVDLNSGITLRRCRIPAGLLQSGGQYAWRVSYRDRNLNWSPWSAEQTFTVVSRQPEADFTAAVTSGPAPLTVSFTDLSEGEPLSWSWDLDGDGTPDSALRDPVFTYLEPGSYSVTLQVQYDLSNSTLTRTDYIVVQSPPPEMGTVVITVQNGWVLLSWPEIPEFTSYAIYSAPDPWGEFTLLGTTLDNNFGTQINSNTRFYRVAGITTP